MTAGKRSRFIAPGTPFETGSVGAVIISTAISPRPTICAQREPDRLAGMIATWWREAERYKVLPLDDRFGPRFAENGARDFTAPARTSCFITGMGHVPTDVAPDVRSRNYTIEAERAHRAATTRAC